MFVRNGRVVRAIAGRRLAVLRCRRSGLLVRRIDALQELVDVEVFRAYAVQWRDGSSST